MVRLRVRNTNRERVGDIYTCMYVYISLRIRNISAKGKLDQETKVNRIRENKTKDQKE